MASAPYDCSLKISSFRGVMGIPAARSNDAAGLSRPSAGLAGSSVTFTGIPEDFSEYRDGLTGIPENRRNLGKAGPGFWRACRHHGESEPDSPLACRNPALALRDHGRAFRNRRANR